MFSKDQVRSVDNLHDIKNLEFEPANANGPGENEEMKSSTYGTSEKKKTSTNSDESSKGSGFKMLSGTTTTTEEAMMYITFKKIVEQFFALYDKASTDKIRKLRSMMQQF